MVRMVYEYEGVVDSKVIKGIVRRQGLAKQVLWLRRHRHQDFFGVTVCFCQFYPVF